MEQKRKRTKKIKPEQNYPPTKKNEVVEGNYSTAIWNNGELISFDIDWTKLSMIVKELSNEKN